MDQWREDAVREGQRKGLAEGQRRGLAEGHRRGLAEGQRKGLAEGQRRGLAEGQRTALSRMAAHRFDAATVEALTARLAEVDDPTRLEAAGDLVATCKTGQELLRRLHPPSTDD